MRKPILPSGGGSYTRDAKGKLVKEKPATPPKPPQKAPAKEA